MRDDPFVASKSHEIPQAPSGAACILIQRISETRHWADSEKIWPLSVYDPNVSMQLRASAISKRSEQALRRVCAINDCAGHPVYSIKKRKSRLAEASRDFFVAWPRGFIAVSRELFADMGSGTHCIQNSLQVFESLLTRLSMISRIPTTALSDIDFVSTER